jgi:hypothetical protein
MHDNGIGIEMPACEKFFSNKHFLNMIWVASPEKLQRSNSLLFRNEHLVKVMLRQFETSNIPYEQSRIVVSSISIYAVLESEAVGARPKQVTALYLDAGTVLESQYPTLTVTGLGVAE